MEDYKYNIGLRLKQARKDKALTQEKISELLGISQKHYSEVERGITGLSVKHLIQISDILSISLNYLLKGVTSSKDMPETVKTSIEINELYYSLSCYTQQQVPYILQIIKDIEKNAKISERKNIK